MVKFCKDGSTAVDAAVRLARAHTGRDTIAICGDHPFFSTSDWFIGTTGMPAGIPQWVRDRAIKFRYNDLASLEALFSTHPEQIACVVLEAARIEEPAPGYPAGPEAAVSPPRRAADIRRDDHRLPLAQVRGAALLRRHARPVELRQGAGQRLRTVGGVRAA